LQPRLERQLDEIRQQLDQLRKTLDELRAQQAAPKTEKK
jgi:prefoldin subunit 5